MAFIHMNDYLFFWAGLVLRSRRPRIVGITGTVGKTTTKEVVAAVLGHPEARRYVGFVGKTPWNMNDNRGLPLTILGYRDYLNTGRGVLMAAIAIPCRAILLATVRRYPKVLVLEYAASDNGDVGRLAALATPTVAIVTTVGPAHLDRFGTVERVAEEKAALVRHVPASGLVILGQDNPYTAAMDRSTSARVVKVPGKGRALSEAIARVVGEFFGVPSVVVEQAIRECGPVKGRLVVHDLGAMTVIDDTFNANPMSMQLGLETMRGMGGAGKRKVAVLGDMAELGVEARRYHVEMGIFARERADLLIGVGEMARAYEPDHWFATSALCAASLAAMLHEGDIVYLKGSHGIHMERVAAALLGTAG